MKYSHLMYLTLISVLTMGVSFYDKDDDIVCIKSNDEMKKIRIKINGSTRTFTATLLDDNTAKAFEKMLPLTIKMTELNGNEKYGDLQNSLPTNPSIPKTITNGDLMLYGSKTLVIFYKTFTTSYSYTKLGQTDDAAVLASALGTRDTVVTFEIE